MSPGWKSAILLDLILGYDGGNSPIIIDQPEDNLAVKYINEALVQTIKKVKYRKQVILVSHNATIPMMADAQTIVLCKNDGKKITIRSASLEGQIGKEKILDLIADQTDGGKASIKKRVKKAPEQSRRPLEVQQDLIHNSDGDTHVGECLITVPVHMNH